jgi:hypothetical protein
MSRAATGPLDLKLSFNEKPEVVDSSEQALQVVGYGFWSGECFLPGAKAGLGAKRKPIALENVSYGVRTAVAGPYLQSC